jgi:hypothetical protein
MSLDEAKQVVEGIDAVWYSSAAAPAGPPAV